MNLLLPQATASGLAVTGSKNLLRGTIGIAQLNASIGPIALTGNGRGIARLTGVMARLALQGLSVTAEGATEPAIKLWAIRFWTAVERVILSFSETPPPA